MNRPSRLLFVLPLFLFASLVLTAPSARADLPGDIQAVLHDKLLARARIGIQIVRLGATENDVQVVYRNNANELYTPASNLKVITTSAAMDRLGADFRFRTMLLLHGEDLILIGDGDPTLGDAEVLKKVGWDTTTTFRQWADRLRQMNVTTVRNVIVDDSIFDDQFLHPRWAKHQFERFGAETGGVNLNANCLDFYVRGGSTRIASYTLDPDTHYASIRNTCVSGRREGVAVVRQPGTNDLTLRGEASSATIGPVHVTIHDPPLYAATALADTLTAAGIKITGKVQRDRTLRAEYASAGRDPKQWTTVGVLETRLAAIITWANKESINLYAECICKRLGAAASNGSGTWTNGTAAVAAFLRNLGIADTEYKLDDGSGLSKENAISANAMVRVLAHDYYSKDSQTFMASLSIGGVDGTLKRRFEGDMRGRVLGKSGFVAGVSALSGYLHAKDGHWYAFSILMNGIPELSNSSIKPLQERIIRALDKSVSH